MYVSTYAHICTYIYQFIVGVGQEVLGMITTVALYHEQMPCDYTTLVQSICEIMCWNIQKLNYAPHNEGIHGLGKVDVQLHIS